MAEEKEGQKRREWVAWNYTLKDGLILYCNMMKKGCEGGEKEKASKSKLQDNV